ncbi:MAG: hypothetical protein JSS20_21230, partial [Proteobacteria bacterium]|nr:hypothetical protein [Pseudomonadota bacterium]
MRKIEDWARGNEIDRMSAEDVRILAHDVGLDSSDIVRLAHMENDASRLLYGRLKELGLTAEMIEAAGLSTQRELERSCAFCSERGVCEHDMHERPESDAWRRLCPNNGAFIEMERQLKSAS